MLLLIWFRYVVLSSLSTIQKQLLLLLIQRDCNKRGLGNKIQKQLLLLLILYSRKSIYSPTYSKTTFVTVNQTLLYSSFSPYLYSKTTFVTVNLSLISLISYSLSIQKQLLLLLIAFFYGLLTKSLEFKNNFCYC